MIKGLTWILLVFSSVCVLALPTGQASAAFIDNGNNLIYDTVLNVTWYNPVPAAMTWTQAMTWASSLTVGGTGAGSWNLPAALPVNGTCYNFSLAYDGSADIGWNISAPGSAHPGTTVNQMAYLYYNELGGIGRYDVNGNANTNFGIPDVGPFTNLLPGSGTPNGYWSASVIDPLAGEVLVFNFTGGRQWWQDETSSVLQTMAVHPGDIGAPVPLPSAILLLAPGLAGLAALKRK